MAGGPRLTASEMLAEASDRPNRMSQCDPCSGGRLSATSWHGARPSGCYSEEKTMRRLPIVLVCFFLVSAAVAQQTRRRAAGVTPPPPAVPPPAAGAALAGLSP